MHILYGRLDETHRGRISSPGMHIVKDGVNKLLKWSESYKCEHFFSTQPHNNSYCMRSVCLTEGKHFAVQFEQSLGYSLDQLPFDNLVD